MRRSFVSKTGLNLEARNQREASSLEILREFRRLLPFILCRDGSRNAFIQSKFFALRMTDETVSGNPFRADVQTTNDEPKNHAQRRSYS